jgi:hypothetical protein
MANNILLSYQYKKMSRNEQLKFHGSFTETLPSLCLQRQNTDYHVVYTTLTFQAGTNATFNSVLELFSIINPVSGHEITADQRSMIGRKLLLIGREQGCRSS